MTLKALIRVFIQMVENSDCHCVKNLMKVTIICNYLTQIMKTRMKNNYLTYLSTIN